MWGGNPEKSPEILEVFGTFLWIGKPKSIFDFIEPTYLIISSGLTPHMPMFQVKIFFNFLYQIDLIYRAISQYRGVPADIP